MSNNIIQPQPKALVSFKRVTHAVHIAYTMAGYGMTKVGEDLRNMEGFNPSGRFQVGPPREGKNEPDAVSEMTNEQAVDGMSKNGPFSQLVADGLIVWVYSLWNEEYRSKIAGELGVPTNQVMCDVMGDVRLIRNWIVHNRSVVDDSVSKITTLGWPTQQGPMLITHVEMEIIQRALNTMQVYLDPSN